MAETSCQHFLMTYLLEHSCMIPQATGWSVVIHRALCVLK